MKRFISVFLCIFLAVSLAGCFSDPLSRLKNAQAKVEAAQTKKEKTEEKVVSKAVPYTFGALYSLGKVEEPSKPVIIAKNLLDSSLTITGPPSFRDSLEFKQIIDGLMDTNMVKIKAAEGRLAAKNQEVIQLQGQIEGLGKDLEKANSKFTQISLLNSEMANKWNLLKRIFWWGVAIAGLFILSEILSVALPQPYGSIFGILSFLGGLVVKFISSVMPRSKEIGSVVSKTTFDQSETALRHLILSINTARQDEELKKKLDPILKDNTTKDGDGDGSRTKIDEVKKNMNLV